MLLAGIKEDVKKIEHIRCQYWRTWRWWRWRRG